MGFPAARLTDMHICPMFTGLVPHVGGPISGPCCPTVLIGSLPAARITDLCVCVGPPDIIVKGSTGVMIGGLPAARITDLTSHGGVIILGWPTVLIGETSAGGGGGAAAAGPASTGGPGEAPAGSTNGPFATADQAARAALNIANPMSVRDNLEYGGMIYRDTHGNYWFTGPGVGTDTGFSPSSTPIPPGTTPAGDYHCHADYSVRDPATGRAIRTSDPTRDDYNSDNFSADDRRGIANDAAGHPGYRGYLGTPSGTFRSYDPATRTTSTLP